MKFDIFSELDAARIEEIKAASKYVQLPKDSILFYEGDVCESVLYLTQGRIKILAGGTDETPAQVPLYDFLRGQTMHRKYRQRPLVKPRHRDRAGSHGRARLAHPRARHPAPHRRISRVSKDRISIIYAALLLTHDAHRGHQI